MDDCIRRAIIPLKEGEDYWSFKESQPRLILKPGFRYETDAEYKARVRKMLDEK